MKADIVLINTIKNYKDFTIENLKPYLKQDVLLIRLPFIRFNGYWPPETFKQLKKFTPSTVIDFPNVDRDTIQKYLDQDISIALFKKFFLSSVRKLMYIQMESDIPFVSFFIKHHLDYPMFRDSYHPTSNILEYVGTKIIEKIKTKFPIQSTQQTLQLTKTPFEYGHYKPIQNKIKTLLGIRYDLDKIFICNQKIYYIYIRV